MNGRVNSAASVRAGRGAAARRRAGRTTGWSCAGAASRKPFRSRSSGSDGPAPSTAPPAPPPRGPHARPGRSGPPRRGTSRRAPARTPRADPGRRGRSGSAAASGRPDHPAVEHARQHQVVQEPGPPGHLVRDVQPRGAAPGDRPLAPAALGATGALGGPVQQAGCSQRPVAEPGRPVPCWPALRYPPSRHAPAPAGSVPSLPAAAARNSRAGLRARLAQRRAGVLDGPAARGDPLVRAGARCTPGRPGPGPARRRVPRRRPAPARSRLPWPYSTFPGRIVTTPSRLKSSHGAAAGWRPGSARHGETARRAPSCAARCWPPGALPAGPAPAASLPAGAFLAG